MSERTLGPAYMHAEDLLNNGRWSERSLTIEKVLAPNTVKSADNTYIDKPIMKFSEIDLGMVVGKTNQRLIIAALGERNPTKWPGKTVTLYPAMGSWFGQENVTTIRVRVPAGSPRPFIAPKTLGVDLTGRRVSVTEESETREAVDE